MSSSLSVPGSPPAEHKRSRAAQRVARLAGSSQLFFTNFEHRARLPLPPAWLPPGADEPVSRFSGGLLAEPKYQAFRHDLLIASFHPCHRAQWTAHELCHALVGFAYRPGASSLFHALSAWLAELLPVTLWYFFDEADVRKCQVHQDAGPLFQTHCPACERAALTGPRPWDAQSERRLREGKQYLKRELAAIARSRRTGLPRGTRFATIDLAEDALSYVQSHRARLNAPEMERFVSQFFAARQGLHESLDALEERVWAMSEHLCGGPTPPAWRATRWDYAAQDVGYRLLTVRAQVSGDAAAELDALVDGLAADRSERGLEKVVAGYRTLAQEGRRSRSRSGLVPAQQLLSVGYDLPGEAGHDLTQLAEGIASACPSTHQALGRERAQAVRAFAAADEPVRMPIGRRFARFMASYRPGPLAELARVEAAITHVGSPDRLASSLDAREARGEQLQLAQGVEVLQLTYDVLSLPPARVKRAAKREQPYALVVLRGADDGVDVLELDAAVAERLAHSQRRALRRAELGESTLRELLDAGVLVPCAYRE